MFTNFKSKTSKIMAFILAACMLLSMIPVSLITVFAATTDYPDSFTVSVKDTQGNPVEGANVQLVNGDTKWSIYLTAQTDANGIAVFDSNEIKTAFEAGVAAGTITSESVLGNVSAIKSGYNPDSNKLVRFYADAGYTEHVEFTMTPPISDVEIAGKNLTYNGEAQELVSVTKVEGDTIEYYLNGATDPVTEVPTAIEAGTYSVRVVVTRTNYLTLDKTVETKINLADIEGIDIAPVTGLKYNGQEQALVTLTGSFATGDTVTWTVNGEETNSSEVPKADAIGNYKVKLTVVRNDNYKTFEKEVDVAIDTGVLNIENLEVKANDRTYDGSTKDALTVKNQGDYNLEYKLGENGTWTTDTIPQITDAGTYKVYVKATKTGYHDAEYPTYPITVTIAQAKITGVTATGYSAKYDKQSHDAITKVEGVLDGDTVTYSKTEDGTYTLEIPSVKNVKDSGTYYVKVFRNDNFETLIIPVTVSITRNDQQVLSFGETPNLTYNEANTFKYVATTNASDADGDIDYEKVGGTANFTVAEDGTVTYTSVGTIKVKATISACDNYEATSQTYEITVSYLSTPAWTITPEVATVGNCKWHNGNVVIKADGYEIIKGSNALGQTTWATDITESTEKDYPDYRVAFKDQAGNVTDLVNIPYFAIDKTIPKLDAGRIGVEFKITHNDALSELIHFLSFGLFCNKEIEVKVNANDDVDAIKTSGVKKYELYLCENAADEGSLVTSENNTFKIPVGFKGVVKVKLYDFAGNETEKILVTSANSNINNNDASGYIMVEDVKPTITNVAINADNSIGYDSNKFSGDGTLTFTVKDDESGLYKVNVKVNGVDYDDQDVDFPIIYTTATSDKVTEKTYTVKTKDKQANEDGLYVFEITVMDNAGNEVSLSSEDTTIYKDKTAPEIVAFDFGKENEAVSIEDYGFYFAEATTVTIKAEDKKAEKEYATGVKTITYYLKDKNDKLYVIDNQGKLEEIENISSAKTVDVTPDGKAGEIKVTIPVNFKGQIFALSTDNVDNKAVSYTHPSGTVLENQYTHEHADYEHITFEKDATSLKTNDEKDNELYANDVPVKITVTDNYSGIAKIEWSVTAPYDKNNEQSGMLTVANNTTVNVGGELDGWKVLSKDINLVTKVEKTITVKNDSNNIKVYVKLTDRAGNTSEETIKFNIDKQSPIMTVEMNDNDDADYNGFFKDSRKYKVTILERNFINKNVEFVVSYVDNDNKQNEVKVEPQFKLVMDGDTPKVTTIGDDEKGYTEYYTYEWNSEFKADGDYKFSISSVDLAENQTEDAKVSYVNDKNEDIKNISKTFTIDNLNPTITVAYDNNSAQNDKFFMKDRTATITIVEHNFDVENLERVVFVRDSFLDKQDIADPEIKWTHNGNTHIATIVYSADGDYTFDVTMTDMAGRESGAANYGDTVAGKEFTVDKTIAKPSITGVENGKAYKNDVIPVISLDDVNFAEYEAVLTRTRKGEKNVDVTDKFINAITTNAKGGSATNDKFEKIADNDGIYTLKVTMTDKAGNKEEDTVTFTVNRFGSVYDFGEYLTKLIANGGSFEQKITEDIVLTEYNPDRLVADSLVIEITRDGKPVENVKFDVSPVINDQVAIGESGWFQYAYKINKENFAADGVYKIAISSKDATGNTPENSNFDDKNILFRVDSTTPEITSITGLEEDIINAQEVTVKYTIFDAIGLKSVTVYVDGKKVGDTITDFNGDANNYSGEFVLTENSSAQKVRILVEDLAGNITDTDAEDFESAYEFNNSVTVSTNIFVRWYANKGLFWGSIAGVVVLAGAVAFFIARRKKKED